MVRRGEIWLARLDPTEGREIRKTRPCLIVSPPDIHDHLPLVLAAPLTTGSGPAPYRIPTRFAGKEVSFCWSKSELSIAGGWCGALAR
jgi:mRNA interferase MazF